MDVLKRALDRVHADDALKQRTVDYIKNIDANVISIDDVKKRYNKRPAVMRRLVIAACAAVVLCVLPIGGYAVYKTPTSYVSVDINPSVELGINAFGKVVSVTPYNADGEIVLGGLDLMNKNVESAVRLIVRSASQNGFIKDDGSTFISVTAETDSDTQARQLEADAETGAQDAIDQENDAATVETEHIGLDRRDDAIALGISPGKLNLIEKLQALDPAITVDAYKDATVSDIQKKFVELKKETQQNQNTEQEQNEGQKQNKEQNENKEQIKENNGQGNGKKEDAQPSASADAAPSSSTGPSPSAPPDAGAKPSHSNNGNSSNDNNGNSGHSNNGNGNPKNNETPAPPSASDGGGAAVSPDTTPAPGDGNNSDNGNNGGGSDNGNNNGNNSGNGSDSNNGNANNGNGSGSGDSPNSGNGNNSDHGNSGNSQK
jgi:hypothetical protein